VAVQVLIDALTVKWISGNLTFPVTTYQVLGFAERASIAVLEVRHTPVPD